MRTGPWFPARLAARVGIQKSADLREIHTFAEAGIHPRYLIIRRLTPRTAPYNHREVESGFLRPFLDAFEVQDAKARFAAPGCVSPADCVVADHAFVVFVFEFAQELGGEVFAWDVHVGLFASLAGLKGCFFFR